MVGAGRMERVPVGVVSYTAPDGSVTPREIVWGDGRRWRVDVEIAEPAGPKPAQGQRPWRYRVRILPSGQRKWLWWDVPGWHVEVRKASCL